MGLLTKVFGKKPSKNSKIDSDTRVDIETLYEEGMKPSEIAAELDDQIPVSRIQRIITNYNRRKGSSAESDILQQQRIALKEKELQIRSIQLDFEIQKLKHDQTEELKQMTLGNYGDEEQNDPFEAIAMMAMERILSPHASPVSGNPDNVSNPKDTQGSGPAPGLLSLSDDEIDDLISKYPEQARYLKNLPQGVAIKIINHQYPGLDQDCIKRALERLRSMKIMESDK